MLQHKKKNTPLYAVVEGCNWHLRQEINKNGKISLKTAGILIINGAKVIHLNSSAYSFVHTFLSSKQNHRFTIWRSALRFGISPTKARYDWQNLFASLTQASHGCCEGTDIQILGDTEEGSFSAPLRVDLATTYHCNNDCTHCYAGGHRETQELSTEEWKQIIEKLHQFGIPQVIFTGGESLLRNDLEDLIAYAKSRQMITGLITNGRLLTHKRVPQLETAGLDFVQITVESLEPTVHNSMVGFTNWEKINPLKETLEGVTNALNSSLQVTTNTTITQENVASVLPTVTYLIQMGVERIGINGIIRAHRGKETSGIDPLEMKGLLRDIRQLCLKHDTQMIWFTPTCYQQLNPISLELGVKSCSAASTVLTIEPTGRVLPCQSYFAEGLGNAVTDSFSKIWHHPLALRLRNREWVDESCRQCDNFTACGGGCPLEK